MKKQKITKLSVFDFDGTLVRSPLPETGKPHYLAKTGKVWPYEGWFGRHESLDLDVFEIPVIQEVVDEFKAEKALDHTYVVMMTGRITKLGSHVQKVLDIHGLDFDECHYNTGGSTEKVKIKTLDKLLAKFPDIDTVELWDDRLPHIEHFENWGREQCLSGRLTDFKINLVPGWELYNG